MASAIKSTPAETFSSKRQKHFNEAKTSELEDRISSLPTELLCRILSYLPTKYAVGSCILSTRWKHLWALVSNIDLDDELFLCPSNNIGGNKYYFTDFVDRVLMLRKASSLGKFTIKCSRGYNPLRIQLWISSAVMQEVKELEISLSKRNVVALPRSVLQCKTVVALKLSHYLKIGCPDSICFPNLKILHLCSLVYLDDDSVKKIISGCPVLEELTITRDVYDKIHSLWIQSSTLRRLSIYFCSSVQKYYKCSVVIETPFLEFIDLGDNISDDFNVNELSHLSEACLSMGETYRRYGPRDKFDGVVIYLLWKFSNVKHLKLSHDIEKYVALACAAGSFPFLYHNLTHLEVEVHESWQFVYNLLKSSPRLEVLICNKRCTSSAYVPHFPYCCTWKTPVSVLPICFSSRLARIQINGFQGCQVEMKLAEFILMNTQFLQTLKIVPCKMDLLLQSNILKELLLCPRGSTGCRIEFS